jgi:hypothetical protein
LDDYKDESQSPKNPHRKFTDEEYQEVIRTFDRTRENVNSRFLDFIEDMHADKRNLSPPKLKAQKRKIWDVRPGVRKIKAIVDELWAEKAKTISKSYVHDLLKKFGKYPEEVNKEKKRICKTIAARKMLQYRHSNLLYRGQNTSLFSASFR